MESDTGKERKPIKCVSLNGYHPVQLGLNPAWDPLKNYRVLLEFYAIDKLHV